MLHFFSVFLHLHYVADLTSSKLMLVSKPGRWKPNWILCWNAPVSLLLYRFLIYFLICFFLNFVYYWNNEVFFKTDLCGLVRFTVLARTNMKMTCLLERSDMQYHRNRRTFNRPLLSPSSTCLCDWASDHHWPSVSLYRATQRYIQKTIGHLFC
jgi:hypothetical protein